LYLLRSFLIVILALGTRIKEKRKNVWCTGNEKRDVLVREKGVLGSENDNYLGTRFES
jgi:hypothetical protein